MEMNKKMSELIEMKNVSCKHHDKLREGFHYTLNNKEMLWLCNFCHMELAGQLLKQLAIQVFMPEYKEDKK